MSNFWSLVFFTVFSLNVGIADTIGQYALLAIACFFSILFILSSPQNIRFNISLLDILPVLMFLAWVYGVSVALYKGVPVEYALKNFVGMALYPVYYFIVALNIERNSLAKSILYGSIFNCIVAVYFFFVWLLSDRIAGSDGSIGDYRSYYSYGLMTAIPVIGLLFYLYISGLVKAVYSIFLLKYPLFIYFFLSFSLIFTTMSKGFILSFLVLHLLLFMLYFLRNLFLSKVSLRLFFISFVTFSSFLIALSATDVVDRIVFSFSGDESSNNIRNEQRYYLFDELTFVGAGLGATLDSGYKRDPAGYGFELNYENLVHKLGVVSMLPFLVYLVTLFLAMYRVFLSKDIFFAVLALGCMMYMIPSYGNPTLFSPTFVIFHILAIYFLRTSTLDLFRFTNPSR